MTRRIKLTIATPEPDIFNGYEVFRVRIEASGGEDMPNEIFGHQRTLVDPQTGLEQDEFCFVTSAFDLSTYPAHQPQTGQSPAYFRKSLIDVLMPNLLVANNFIAGVQAEVARLIYIMDHLDLLAVETELWIPSPPEGPPDPDESLVSEDSSLVSEDSSLGGV
jgi:hypothetical protein